MNQEQIDALNRVIKSCFNYSVHILLILRNNAKKH
nr:MAG TPA: GTPase-activating protein [Caudoviricetes sp.]